MIKFNIDQVELIGTVFKVKNKGVKIEVTNEISKTEHLKIIQILEERKLKKYSAKKEVLAHKMFQLLCPYVVGDCYFEKEVEIEIKNKKFRTVAYVVGYNDNLVEFKTLQGLYWMFPNAFDRYDFVSILFTSYVMADNDIRYTHIKYDPRKRHFIRLDFDDMFRFDKVPNNVNGFMTILNRLILEAPMQTNLYYNKYILEGLKKNIDRYILEMKQYAETIRGISNTIYIRMITFKRSILEYLSMLKIINYTD